MEPTCMTDGRAEVRDLGRLAYHEAWELQKRLVAQRHAGEAPDTLLVVEHEPVITVGRGAKGEVLAAGHETTDATRGGAPATPIVAVERGGQATWHGPGQIVVYPIVKLADDRHDLHGWMRALEEATIRAMGEFGLVAGRREGATGVWIDGERKLCSIGVAATRWVTWHGLALNHENDLAAFAAINPCGFDAAVMTSMRRELEDAAPPGAAPPRAVPPRQAVVAALVRHLQDTLAPFRESA
ncbi:MAG TPA: lipoyl(octanoyl) transferase LipB [Planctomycetota bacterium]|nr:lipoyl(octanoyl) transferase LipB [Planctomycetota bacterium]